MRTTHIRRLGEEIGKSFGRLDVLSIQYSFRFPWKTSHFYDKS